MTTISERIDAIKDLIKQREDIDRKLEALFGGGSVRNRTAQKCSICGDPSHNAKSCPQKKEQGHVTISTPAANPAFGSLGNGTIKQE